MTLRAVLSPVYGALCWALFLVLALAALLLTLPFPALTQRREVTRAAIKLFLALAGIRVRVTGLATLPDDACVVVANHQSYLDGLIMHAVLPARFAFIIKKEMVTVPLAGFLLRRLGNEFVERHDRTRAATDARRVLRRAAGGEALACFPEGTFRREPGLLHFHAGAFVAAARAGLDVVPAAIRGSRAVLAEGDWFPWPGRIEVQLLTRIAAPALDEADGARRLRLQARQAILSVLDEPDALAAESRGTDRG